MEEGSSIFLQLPRVLKKCTKNIVNMGMVHKRRNQCFNSWIDNEPPGSVSLG